MQKQHPDFNGEGNMTDVISDHLLTAEAAGRFLGLKTSTIRRMTYAGELPVVRPTGKRAVRYRHSDLEALLRMRSQPMRGSSDKAVVRAGV
jgi:excisionase family DNA binding protein